MPIVSLGSYTPGVAVTTMADPEEATYQPVIEQESFKTMLAGATLARFVKFKKKRDVVNIEPGSVYGAAVLLPQLARSTFWGNRHFVTLTITGYFYLFLCIAMHGAVLMFLAKEEQVMDDYAGQPYLCDFGTFMESTPQMGPGGTEMTPARLYSWSQYSTRAFVRDALKAIFPDKADTIDKFGDPGEYGVESYWCRLLCVLLFVVSIIPEIKQCVSIIKLIMLTPSESKSWIRVKEHGKVESGIASDCMNNLRVQVSGMPPLWKFINFIFVCLPKCILVGVTAQAGVNFLMETAGIDDIIVNSVALGFLLMMDDMICQNLMCDTVLHLVANCESLVMYEDDDLEELDEATTMRKNHEPVAGNFMGFFYNLMFNLRMLPASIILTIAMVALYYQDHCIKDNSGRWVSEPVYTPIQGEPFNILNAFFPELFPFAHDTKTPYWTMPDN